MNKKKYAYLDLKEEIESKIRLYGGWVNTHAHIDRAYSITKKNAIHIHSTLQEKWFLNDELKRRSSVSEIYDRMAYAVESMISQGVQALGSFIDIDEVIKDKAIKAAEKIREKYKSNIKICYINQTLKGVIEKKARYWFDYGSEFVDIIGGLPGKDKGREGEHLDIVLSTAKELHKMAHIHVDQLNTAAERETELLAWKTLEHDMVGNVVAIHGVSISAHPMRYKKVLYEFLKKAQLFLITCPSAWIDSRRTEELAPTHNAIAPVEELAAEKITVALGTDNIFDIYKPFSDGNMWNELRFLLEACHYYDTSELAKIASINGLKVLKLHA